MPITSPSDITFRRNVMGISRNLGPCWIAPGASRIFAALLLSFFLLMSADAKIFSSDLTINDHVSFFLILLIHPANDRHNIIVKEKHLHKDG